jgi:hypothetical protein
MKFEKSLVVVFLSALCALLVFTAYKKRTETETQKQPVVQEQPVVVKPIVVPHHLVVLDDVSDSICRDVSDPTASEVKCEEARSAKEKFVAGIGNTRFLSITLIRIGRGNLNAARNNFEFKLPAPPEPVKPDYESLGPVGKTNKALREQKEQEADALYQKLKQKYEGDYQAAFKKFEETFFNIDDALKTKADACVNAEWLRERLADEAKTVSKDMYVVIFSDGQFCESKTEPQPLTVKTAIVLYADLSAEAESLYQKQVESLFPKAHTVKAIQADRALKVLNTDVAQK